MDEFNLSYIAPNTIRSSCDVKLDLQAQLVIVSETGDGMSITNAAARIASVLVQTFDLNPQRLIYIEHYPNDSNADQLGESYDLVTFSWQYREASNPLWQHLPADEFNAILKQLVTHS